MLRLAWNEPNRQVRRYYLSCCSSRCRSSRASTPSASSSTGCSFPGSVENPIERPVFVVGHARSGTTFVHRLMSQDEDRFSVFRLYELYFPSLLQKKLIRGVAAPRPRDGSAASSRRA